MILQVGRHVLNNFLSKQFSIDFLLSAPRLAVHEGPFIRYEEK